MENKTNKKELSLWIECLTVIALATTLTFINCNKKEDDKTPLFAAAALASRGSGTVATATGTATGTGTGAAATYAIGGTITGLTATGLVLQNNAGDDLTLASGATSFTFITKVSGTYAVTVKTQPTGLKCTVSSGTGTATANVTNISIACVTLGFGNALEFGAVALKQHVTIGTIPDLRGASAYTIEMWVLIESGVTILGTKVTSDIPKIDIELSGTGLNVFQNNTQAGYRGTGAASITLSTWTHIAVVFDGTLAAADRLKVYKNGTLIAGAITGTVDTTTSATLGPVTLGAQPGSNPPTSSGFFYKGKMDDLRIWKVARTQAEIQNNRNTPLSNPTGESNLIAYYKFDSTSGTTLIDEKGSFNGTLQNMTDANWISSGANSN
jgi:hypothetical protein